MSFIYKLGNQREWVRVPNRPLIEASVILDGSELAVLLFDEEEGGSVWAFGRTNIPFLGVFDDKFLQFVLFLRRE